MKKLLFLFLIICNICKANNNYTLKDLYRHKDYTIEETFTTIMEYIVYFDRYEVFNIFIENKENISKIQI